MNRAISISDYKNINPFFKIHNDINLNDLLYAVDVSSIVALTDRNGIITYANDNFCKISKYSREELVGQNHRILNSGFHSKKFFKEMWKVISSGQAWKGEIQNKAKDGSYYWVFTSIVPIFNNRGKIREFVSIRYDITKEKKTEQEMKMAHGQILQSKINQESSERFVSTLIHDLRTPLTTVKLSAQMIEKNLSKPQVLKKYLLKILQNIDCADEMINDLLNVTRIRAGHKIKLKLLDCDCAEISRKSIEDLTAIHGDRFRLQVQGDCVGLMSPSGIKRVIENLCNNAVKYGSNDTEILVKVQGDAKEIVMSIHNYGGVISKDDYHNLFNYLERTVAAQDSGIKGWGIGLTIVKGIVMSHGGTIQVMSNEVEGTTFTIRLPKKS